MEAAKELGLNLSVLIAQIINVAVLFFLMLLVAYKPIMKMLEKRRTMIAETVAEKEEIKKVSAAAAEEAKMQIEAARAEGQKLVAQAVREGEEIRRKSLEEAQAEAKVMLEKERVRIRKEQEEAAREVRKHFADLAIFAAEKVIQQSLDKEAHRGLIEKVLDESVVSKTN